ncbi:MAG: flagellar basal body P-ring formation chaperone FlgA [Synergistaceae bacterium]|nr:flagellar basal body P-ring formation chaperone FlgA [Synergistaceae bacterium]
MNGRIGRRLLRLFFVSAFILLFPCFAAAANRTLQISIPDVVRSETDACALWEIADISGPQALVRQAGELLLMIENGVITREQVVDALQVSGLDGVRFELKMPRTVRVEKGAPENGGLLQDTGRQGDLPALIKSLASWDGEVEVRYQGGMPEGRLVAPASIVPGTAAATLRFRNDSGAERSLAVRLTWTQPVLVLTRSLRRGEIPKETDVTVRQIRVSRPGVYASKFSDVAGRAVRKNLSQGEALALNLLADVPIIERGKNVTIVVRSGGMVIRTRGEAMENGGLGDEIRVRNVASKTVITAVVVANDTVEVKMP